MSLLETQNSSELLSEDELGGEGLESVEEWEGHAMALVTRTGPCVYQPTADYSPFPTKSFALAYLLANSLHPVVSAYQ